MFILIMITQIIIMTAMVISLAVTDAKKARRMMMTMIKVVVLLLALTLGCGYFTFHYYRSQWLTVFAGQLIGSMTPSGVVGYLAFRVQSKEREFKTKAITGIIIAVMFCCLILFSHVYVESVK